MRNGSWRSWLTECMNWCSSSLACWRWSAGRCISSCDLPLAADLREGDRAPDGRGQSRQFALQEVIVGAGSHHLHCDLLARAAGDDDDRRAAAVLLADFQCLDAAKSRQRVIEQDHIPAVALQRLAHLRLRLDAVDAGIESILPEDAGHQLGIFSRIFNHEDAK